MTESSNNFQAARLLWSAIHTNDIVSILALGTTLMAQQNWDSPFWLGTGGRGLLGIGGMETWTWFGDATLFGDAPLAISIVVMSPSLFRVMQRLPMIQSSSIGRDSVSYEWRAILRTDSCRQKMLYNIIRHDNGQGFARSNVGCKVSQMVTTNMENWSSQQSKSTP